MEIEIEIEEARRRWPELLARAADGDRVVLLVDGQPIGALVGEDDLMAVLLGTDGLGHLVPRETQPDSPDHSFATERHDQIRDDPLWKLDQRRHVAAVGDQDEGRLRKAFA